MTDKTRKHENRLTDTLSARQSSRRDVLQWSTVLALSLQLPSATHAQEASPPAVSGGTLRFAADPPATIEPHQINDDPGIGIVHQVCEMLVDTDAEGVLQPRLATEWTPSEGGRVWTVQLREGVTFHNGQLMTANDVVATFQRLVDPDSGSSALATFEFLSQEGITSDGEYTVIFSLDRAVVDFPAYLNSFQAVILPADWPGNFAENPIGTGAFMLEEYVPQQRAQFVRNPNYWIEGLPYLDSVEAIIIAAENAITALQGGSIEMITSNPGAAPLFQDNPDIQVLTTPGSGHNGIFMRVDQEPFSDKRVRQAMALCMDRDALIDSVWHGFGELGNDHVIAPVFPLHTPIEQREQDYEAAIALLTEAGYPDGFTATVTTSSDTTPLPALAAVVQEMLRPSGIGIEIEAIPSSTYFDTAWLEMPLTITNWGGRATPSQYLTSAYVTGSVWNASHWSNPTFDELVAQLDSELDFERRKELALQIEEIMREEVPAIIPYFIVSVSFVRDNVQGYIADRIGFRDLRRTYLRSSS